MVLTTSQANQFGTGTKNSSTPTQSVLLTIDLSEISIDTSTSEVHLVHHSIIEVERMIDVRIVDDYIYVLEAKLTFN